MGLKQSERLRFNASYEISDLLLQDDLIAADFKASFFTLVDYPKITVEQRVVEAPAFEGFWVYGDGVGVTLSEQVEVEFELLHNSPTSQNSYTQTSLLMRTSDKKYKDDYAGYYKSGGKQLKNIRKRLELLACCAVLELYRFWGEAQLERFSRRQLKILFTELRVLKRFTGVLDL